MMLLMILECDQRRVSLFLFLPHNIFVIAAVHQLATVRLEFAEPVGDINRNVSNTSSCNFLTQLAKAFLSFLAAE